jgi:hypothetical protein
MAANDPFDPYSQWLGLDARAGLISYYSLLGLPPFEADAGLIAQAADERMKLIRQYQTGPRGKYTQRVLNELASARICLLSPANKAAYDTALRAALTPPAVPVASPPKPKRKLAEIMPPAWEEAVAPPVVTSASSPPQFFLTEAATKIAGIDVAPRRSRGPLTTVIALAGLIAVVAVLGYVFTQRMLNPPAKKHIALVSDDQGAEENPAEVKPEPMAVKEPPAAKTIVVLQEGSGELNLTPATALVEGKLLREVLGSNEALVGWASPTDVAEWQFKLVKPGFFELELQYLSHPNLAGKIVSIGWDKEVKRLALRGPEGDAPVRDSQIVLIKRGGEHSLTVQPTETLPAGALQLLSIRLIPATGP